MHLSGHIRVSSDVPRHVVRDALASGGFHAGNPRVDVRDTHAAWVFLAGALAYKVFKPVRTDLLDFSTLEKRRLGCREEVHANRELAPAMAMRVRAIVAGPRSLLLADEGSRGAVEYAIEMRRFDDARTMASLARRGELTHEHVAAIAQRLAAFHARAPRHSSPHPFLAVMRANQRNIEELLALAGTDAARSVQASARFAEAFLLAHGRAIAARADAGFIRDGHGDLRAANIVHDDRLSILDRVSHDPWRRKTDVAEDLACLVMDLERLGDQRAADALVQCYWDAGGELCSPELLAFYGAQHALVRAKVELLRAHRLDDEEAAPAERAAELLHHAERLAWRARGPMVLAIAGPTVGGESPLAAELSRRSGFAVLSSDLVRAEQHPPVSAATAGEPAGAPIECAKIYRELGTRARDSVLSGHSVIVDATFGHLQLRAEFLEGLRDSRALHAFEYHGRHESPLHAAGQDAKAGGANAIYHAWDQLRGMRIVTVRPPTGVEYVVDEIADWLDARQSAVWSPE